MTGAANTPPDSPAEAIPVVAAVIPGVAEVIARDRPDLTDKGPLKRSGPFCAETSIRLSSLLLTSINGLAPTSSAASRQCRPERHHTAGTAPRFPGVPGSCGACQ